VKKGIISDSIVWIALLLVGMLVRPYFSPRLEGIFAAFTVANILSGLIVGITWVILRTITRQVIARKLPKWIVIIVIILLVPLSLLIGHRLFSLLGFDPSRIVLMFPLYIAGFAWGIYSEVKSK
jgi:hypothetical protein